jgi:cell division protein FtsB
MIVEQRRTPPRIPVTDDFEYQVRQALRRRRTPRVLIFVVIAIAAAAIYLWFNYGGLVQSFATSRAAAPEVNSGEERVTRKDLEDFRRQMAESLQSTIEDMDTQKAELKKLSDRVSALTAKIDVLQSTAPATASVSSSTELRSGTQPASPARTPVIATRKKPPAPKTTGPISVGGAPLPPATAVDR